MPHDLRPDMVAGCHVSHRVLCRNISWQDQQMTPKERAAMQQALEALREYRDTQMISAPRKAIEALREALDHSADTGNMVQPVSKEPMWSAEECDRVIKTLRYIQGIAERGEGREMRDDETLEQFVLGYVKKLEQPVSQEYQDHLVNQTFDWSAMAAKNQFMEGYRIGLTEMREKCAKVCEDIDNNMESSWKRNAINCAAAIRARGEKDCGGAQHHRYAGSFGHE